LQRKIKIKIKDLDFRSEGLIPTSKLSTAPRYLEVHELKYEARNEEWNTILLII